MEPQELGRITALLDQIAGRNQGRRLVERLLETRDAPRSIAREVARSPGFERLYEVRTVAVAPQPHQRVWAGAVTEDGGRGPARGHFLPARNSRANPAVSSRITGPYSTEGSISLPSCHSFHEVIKT